MDSHRPHRVGRLNTGYRVVSALACAIVSILSASPRASQNAQAASWDFQDLCWAPDGKSIVFTGVLGDAYGLYRVKAGPGGTPTRLLASLPGRQISPSFAPDGRHFAFLLSTPERNSIFVANADGTDPHEIFSPGSTPSWSPDGKSIAFAAKVGGVSQIAVMDPSGGHLRQLTHDARPSFNATWSPNGRTLVYESDRDGDKRDELYAIDADGEHEHLVLRQPEANLVYPSFTPDGKRIFFAAGANKNVDEYVMDVDGGNVRLFRSHASHAQWSRATGMLAFIGYDDARLREIFLIAPDGTGLVQVTALNHGR